MVAKIEEACMQHENPHAFSTDTGIFIKVVIKFFETPVNRCVCDRILKNFLKLKKLFKWMNILKTIQSCNNKLTIYELKQ